MHINTSLDLSKFARSFLRSRCSSSFSSSVNSTIAELTIEFVSVRTLSISRLKVLSPHICSQCNFPSARFFEILVIPSILGMAKLPMTPGRLIFVRVSSPINVSVVLPSLLGTCKLQSQISSKASVYHVSSANSNHTLFVSEANVNNLSISLKDCLRQILNLKYNLIIKRYMKILCHFVIELHGQMK